MTVIVWHYTIGSRAANILEDGIIRGAAAGVPAGERPLVWFSSRQLWEPTATKGIVVNGVRRDATMQEMMAERGLWRFGISVSELLPWKALREQGNIGADTARDLIRAARRVGADPSFWYGSLAPMVVDRCLIQCRLKDSDDWGGLPAAE